jgi:hypothetical protein
VAEIPAKKPKRVRGKRCLLEESVVKFWPKLAKVAEKGPKTSAAGCIDVFIKLARLFPKLAELY